MFEKVNPDHPDKLADRVAGAIVDLAYKKQEDPRIAVEVLLGHGRVYIIAETSVSIEKDEIGKIVSRIVGDYAFEYIETRQDPHLAKNQEKGFRCGDNGIFKGVPVTKEQRQLMNAARQIYEAHKSDGKYIIDEDAGKFIICQSNATMSEEKKLFPHAVINPLGEWTGGPGVDAGATNRKLGSDMGDSVTGGGLHGKDLSKADVSVNIYCWLYAQTFGRPKLCCCAIGDEMVDGRPYSEIVSIAREYIKLIGGFEKFAEWGLIR